MGRYFRFYLVESPISSSKVAFRELGVVEGGSTDCYDRVGYLNRAREVGRIEGPLSDLHERSRLREVKASKLGVLEGGVADRRDLGGDLVGGQHIDEADPRRRTSADGADASGPVTCSAPHAGRLGRRSRQNHRLRIV